MKKERIAFIGLGVMGYPMAGHLHTHGYDTCVYNRTIAKAQKFVEEYGGTFATTPALAAENCDVVFACVGDDDDVRAIALGDKGAFASMRKGSVFVDHTTASASLAQELAAIARPLNIGFIDAPISGGQAGAEKGILTVMSGGDPTNFQAVKPIIAAYSKKCILIGDVGAGQLTKMVNQICIAGLVQALAEALNFGKKAGLDMEKAINVISGGSAQSWQLENRSHTMLNSQFDHGFATEWMRKDLKICLNTATSMGASLPVTALVDQYYAQIIATGGKRWDMSSLIHLLSEATDVQNK